jgi:hypothetical protein
MKKLIPLIILIFAFSAFGQTPAAPCAVSNSNLPEIRGLKLGMSQAELIRLVGNPDNLKPFKYRLSRNESRAGTTAAMSNQSSRDYDVGAKSYTFLASRDAAVADFFDVHHTVIGFYNDAAFNLQIAFDAQKPEWQTPTDLINAFAPNLGAPADIWMFR